MDSNSLIINDKAFDQPKWVQSQKKRTVTNHLMHKRKTGFSITKIDSSRNANGNMKEEEYFDIVSSKNGFKENQLPVNNEFNIFSFKNQPYKRFGSTDKSSSTKNLTLETGSTGKFSELNPNFERGVSYFDEDLPPKRSLYDDENQLQESKDFSSEQSGVGLINRDPKQFANVFDGNKNNEKGIFNFHNDIKDLRENKEDSGYGLIIFGYPEEMSVQILDHFKKFGKTLEQFNENEIEETICMGHISKKKVAPILTGSGWVRITFVDEKSAESALQENGTVFNGSLIGVVSVNDYNIKQLQTKTTTKAENITSILNKKRNSSYPTALFKQDDDHETKSDLLPLDIRDGRHFFLSNDKSLNENFSGKNKSGKLSFIQSISKIIFGLNEL